MSRISSHPLGGLFFLSSMFSTSSFQLPFSSCSACRRSFRSLLLSFGLNCSGLAFDSVPYKQTHQLDPRPNTVNTSPKDMNPLFCNVLITIFSDNPETYHTNKHYDNHVVTMVAILKKCFFLIEQPNLSRCLWDGDTAQVHYRDLPSTR